PEWCVQPYPDWPSHLRLTGFPLYDGKPASLPPEVEAFLAQGEPPIAFTAGTATGVSHDFFSVSARAGFRASWWHRHDESGIARRSAAMKLLPRDYRVKNVVNALERLTGDAAIRARCVELAGNFRDDSVATACDHILKVLGPMAAHAI
ncbi:MAG: hypothetical protein ACYDA1_10450, partial [Vulcanimicrobiaceae bacterium]